MNTDNDRYQLLINFIVNAADRRGFQYLNSAERIFILIGFDQEFVEFYFNNDQFEANNIRSDTYLIIKEIRYSGNKYFICNFPFIRDINDNEEKKRKYSISKYLAHYLIKQIESKKSIIYTIINDRETQQFSRENMNEAIKHFFISQQMIDFSSNIETLTIPSELFQTFLQLNNTPQDKNLLLKGIDQLALDYIQPKLEEYLSEIKSNLQNMYQTLQLLVQFPKDTEQFNKKFLGYLLKLSLQLQTINNKQFIQLLNCIAICTTEKSEELKEQIESLQRNRNVPFRIFCQINKKQFKELYLECNINCEQFQRIYESYYWAKIPVDWGIQIIVQIKEFILYQAKQIECFEKNDMIYKMNQIQTINQQEIQGRVGVFLLGYTQIGKSTFISILENPNNVDIDEDEDGRNVFIQKKNIQTNFRINSNGFSNENRSIYYLNQNNYQIYDLPGLNDTYEEFRIINLINISNHISQFQQPILLLFLNCESKKEFIECFKNTIDALKILNNNFLNEFESSLIFILSKQPKKSFLNTLTDQNRQEFLGQPDIANYAQEFAIFFKLLNSQRVISFPSAQQNFDLNQFKNQVLEKLDQLSNQLQNNQQIFQENRRIQWFQNNHYHQSLQQLKIIINQQLNFTAQYICESNVRKIIYYFQKSIDKKKEDIQKFQKIIRFDEFSTVSQLYELLQNWCKECNYEISSLDMSQIKKFELFNNIFNFTFQTDMKNIDTKLQKMSDLIKDRQNKKAFKIAVYTATGIVLGTMVGGVGVGELIAKGGQEIITQVARRAFFGLGSIVMSSVCNNYNQEDYEDNVQFIDLYFESNLDRL